MSWHGDCIILDVINKIGNTNMTDKIKKTPLISENWKQRDLLVFIIQTLDREFTYEVQSKDNPIGLIRDKVDKVLNNR